MPDKNTLSSIRESFISMLKDKYETNEISSFFYLSAAHLINYSKARCISEGESILSPDIFDAFMSIAGRLEYEEPIQYILGETEFYGLIFKVDRRVLIPRQETEELVHLVIQREKTGKISILDIGTGSGCIAVTLGVNMHGIKAAACDISEEALEVAALNAGRNGAEVSFFTHDITGSLPLPGIYDVSVSNPPYVRLSERAGMQRNVLDYEPYQALFVPDEDPLVFYRHIARECRKSLIPGGRLYLEINENLPLQVYGLLEESGYAGIEIINDLNGKPRIVYAVNRR
jgi:release factor glutamine methyltransferase